jgi:xylose isomerase
MSDAYVPTPDHKFAFGLWTVGHQGRDPFGDAVRPWVDPVDLVKRLGELGVWGVSYHDDDLLAPGEGNGDRAKRIERFSVALADTGVVCSMATTNLFFHPVFRDGAFTANDPAVRRFALRKVMDNLDVAAELGAKTYVCWGGREGTDTDSAKDVRVALDRFKEAFDILGEYVLERGYDIRFAIEPKPNEPRVDIFLPTVGHALAFIDELEHPELVGLNPEVGHEQMSNLNFHHAIAQTLWHGKLFHIDLNAQKGPRFDMDHRFAAEGQKEMLFLVGLLEKAGYAGPKHFDCRAYRTEDLTGVWDFARGCMRNYLILAERFAEFEADPEVQAARVDAGVPDLAVPTRNPGESIGALRASTDGFDADARGAIGAGYDRLDQLAVEHLLGVRR